MQRPGPFDLPAPDPEAAAHSERLRRHICRRIADQGAPLSFAAYMDLALYAPALGYYNAGSRKFGAGGDFVTAPEISPLFGRALARQIEELQQQLGAAPILEFGAGSGALAATLLQALHEGGHAPSEYLILELSAELRARQAQTLQQQVPELWPRVRWLEQLPGNFSGIIVANEVLDAIPCERFIIRDGQARQLLVDCRDDQLHWHEGPALPALDSLLQRRGLAELDGYRSEYNPRADAWIRAIGETLQRGAAILIDYGYPESEYYLPDRRDGTLRCYYRHRAHDDPFWLPGLQDITAHVDFTAIAETALAAGLEVLGFTGQGNFLIGCGLDEVARDLQAMAQGNEDDGLRSQLELAGQIRQLTLPGEMGETFKALVLGRNIDGPLRGFRFNDQRWRLGGSDA